MLNNKKVIYQLLPRLFDQDPAQTRPNGSLAENGCGKINSITSLAISELRNIGVTDIWLTGVIRHAGASAYPEAGIEASHPDLLKGKAGSPYAVRDYYDIDPDLAVDVDNRMTEFEDFIHRAKDLGIGSIIDFIPNHVSRDYESLAAPEGVSSLGKNDNTGLNFHPNNNFYYLPGEELELPGKGKIRKNSERFSEIPAKVTGNDIFNRCPSKNDWYETIKLNYGIDYLNNKSHFQPIPDTWKKMLNILQYWSAKGISGFRCDMAGMVPPEFWKFAISSVKAEYPNILFIAEIYEPEKYREFIDAGFDYLYDKVGLYDTTRALIEGRGTAQELGIHWKSLTGLDNFMLRFLENHDEQRIASKFFANDPMKGLPGMALAALMNSGPVLLYFGQEVGENADGAEGYSGDDGRTSIFDYSSVPELFKWSNGGLFNNTLLSQSQKELRESYQKLLLFAARNPVFSQGDFYDLMWINEDLPSEIKNRFFAFLRHTETDCYIIAVSFLDQIKDIRIRLTDHPLEYLGLAQTSRFSLETMHPIPEKEHILISQLTSSGIQLKFDRSGWTVIKLTV